MVKKLPASAGDTIQSLGEGNGNLFSVLAWETPQWSLAGHSPQGCKEADPTQRLKQGRRLLQLYIGFSVIEVVYTGHSVSLT